VQTCDPSVVSTTRSVFLVVSAPCWPLPALSLRTLVPFGWGGITNHYLLNKQQHMQLQFEPHIVPIGTLG
jgi:hypothetical protein